MNGYDLHPEAIVDLDEIWEFIAADSVAAADKVNDRILDAIAAVVPFPQATVALTSPHARCGSFAFTIT